MTRDILMDYRGGSRFLGNVAHKCNECGIITHEKLEICCDNSATKEPYQLSGFGKVISYTFVDESDISIFPMVTIKTEEDIVEKEAAWVGIEKPDFDSPAEFRIRITRFDKRPYYNTPTRPYSEPLFNSEEKYLRKDFEGDEPIIEGFGTYVGFYVMPTKDFGRSDIKEKRVSHFTEDALTMAAEAARYADLRSGSETKGFGTIRLGTEFTPTDSQSYAIIAAKKLNVPNTYDPADLRSACLSGIDALVDGYRAIGSGDSDWAFAMGSDIASYLARRNVDLEKFTADGASAFKLGKGNKNNAVATFHKTKEGRISCRFGDFIPDYDVDKRGNAFHGRRFTGGPAYYHVSGQVADQIQKHFDIDISDFAYATFHDPNQRFPLTVGKNMGFSDSQLEPHQITPLIGNCYGGMIPAIWALENAKPEDPILIVKYGSGAGGLGIVLEKGYADNVHAGPTVDELIEHKKIINRKQYEEIMRIREDILGFG